MTSSHKYHARALTLSIAALLLSMLVPAAGAAPREFDHTKFDALLGSAVSNGRVDYGAFRGSAAFTAYLSSLENASPGSLSTDEQLAFWLNAYNALVIRNVLDNPGMRRPTDVKGFFDGRKFKVAGKSLTLNEIENTMIRAKFNEPLIHFGLVCAARSCPPLGSRAFAGRTVRAQLARNAAGYLASPYNRYDPSRNRLELSKIFEWYKGDFGGDAGIRAFVKKYGTTQMKSGVSSSTAVGFMEYDWTLNAR